MGVSHIEEYKRIILEEIGKVKKKVEAATSPREREYWIKIIYALKRDLRNYLNMYARRPIPSIEDILRMFFGEDFDVEM